MKTAAVALLVVTLLIPIAYGQQEDSARDLGQPPKPPEMNLHMAALQGNVDAVRQHIEAGSDLNEKDQFGSTPLIIATTFDRAEVAAALIDAGAGIEVETGEGSTPLLVAAFLGRTEIVELLLENGARKYVRNVDGATAFDVVTTPFEDFKDTYDQIRGGLAPLGLRMDYEQIKMARPRIAELLRPQPQELESVEYAPLLRDDWEVSTPEEQGLDPKVVAEVYLEAAEMENLYGLLVVKNGYLIAERYFNEGAVDRETKLQSVTKSYTSALIGIALDRGCLSSPDQRIMEFFPEIAGQVTDPRKQQITIRHLLQMRAGYPWEEIRPDLWEGLLSGHNIPLIEGVSLVADPGTEFNYSNLSSNWLGIILARACGMDLRSYAEEHLLSPIGAGTGEWGLDRDGYNTGCANLHATARDAARFGLLYLNDGEYEGNQVVPSSWVRESLHSYSDDAWVAHARLNKVGLYFRDLGYGYQWWSASAGGRRFNFAWGHGGQLIVLLDDLDMVVVVTSDPFFLQHDDEAWMHEQANINLVGKFIRSLPTE